MLSQPKCPIPSRGYYKSSTHSCLTSKIPILSKDSQIRSLRNQLGSISYKLRQYNGPTLFKTSPSPSHRIHITTARLLKNPLKKLPQPRTTICLKTPTDPGFDNPAHISSTISMPCSAFGNWLTEGFLLVDRQLNGSHGNVLQ